MATVQHYKNPRLLNLVAGTVFLGVPHYLANKDQFWDRIYWMIKCSCRTNLRRVPTSELAETLPMLADVAKRFEDIQLRPSILNICETGSIKLRRSHFSMRAKNVVVGTPDSDGDRYP